MLSMEKDSCACMSDHREVRISGLTCDDERWLVLFE